MAVLGISFSGLAVGQDANWAVHPALQDRWSFDLGAYSPNVKSSASLNGTRNGVGTTVNFEDTLGLSDHKTVGEILGRVRLGERWRIEGEYFSLNRSGSRAINQDINWGDNIYHIGTVVASEFNSNIYRLSVGYSFIKSTEGELGIVIGAHVTDFSTSLAADSVGTVRRDTLAPLPTVGLYGAYAFTPRWLLSGRGDVFGLNYGDYDGTLVNVKAGLDYRVSRHFGVGAGYRYVNYDVNMTKTKFTGNVSYEFNGPTVYATTSF
jgi:hypothetical protein